MSVSFDDLNNLMYKIQDVLLRRDYCPFCLKNNLSQVNLPSDGIGPLQNGYICLNCDKLINKSESITIKEVRDAKINKILNGTI